MSTWLSCGIATKITVIKDGDTKENILNNLGKEIDLEIYNITEDSRNVVLSINEKVFEENAIQFVKEQVKMFRMKSQKFKNILEKLDELENKSYQELLEISQNHECIHFQFAEGCLLNNNVNYLIKGHTAYVDLIEYIADGKVFMECWNDVFYYLRNAIIKSSDNKIKTAAVITITG